MDMPTHLNVVQDTPMGHIFDLDRHPIDAAAPVIKDLIARGHRELSTTGCAVVRGFVKPQSLARMQAEVQRKATSIGWLAQRQFRRPADDEPPGALKTSLWQGVADPLRA